MLSLKESISASDQAVRIATVKGPDTSPNTFVWKYDNPRSHSHV